MVYDWDYYYLQKYKEKQKRNDTPNPKTPKKGSMKKITAVAIAALGLFLFGITYSTCHQKEPIRKPNITEQVSNHDIKRQALKAEKSRTIEDLCNYHGIEEELERNVGMLTNLYKPTIEKIFTQATKYEDYFEEAARITGLDKEFIKAYISTESGHTHFSKNALSPSGAVGPAQIMEETAKFLNLKIIKNKKGKILYDERRDPEKSIIASAHFIKEWIDVHKGDLILGLAAYNSGPTRVESLIKKKRTDKFKQLFRAGETRQYIIKVLSRMEALKYSNKYGLNIDKEPLYSSLRTNAKTHVLKTGETVYSLTRTYPYTTLDAIKKANPAILNFNDVPSGMKLYIPVVRK